MGHERARFLYVWGEIVISAAWVVLVYVAQLNDWLYGQVMFMDTLYVVQFLILSTLVLLNGWNDPQAEQRREELAKKNAEHLVEIGVQNRAQLQKLNDEIVDLKSLLKTERER